MSQPLARDLCWIVNYQIDGEWKYGGVQRLVRGLVPQDIIRDGRAFCWNITSSEGISLVKSAVKEGTWISLPNLRLICNHCGLDPPERGQGSGKKGAVTKIDWARKLVEHLYPHDSLEEKKRMIAALTWKSGRLSGLKDKEREILEMVAQLDEENREAPEFQRLINLAKNRLKEQEKREVESSTRKLVESEMKRSQLEEEERLALAAQQAAKAAEQEARKVEHAASSSSAGNPRKPSATPPMLKDFLTAEMVEQRISLNRDPAAYGYRAYYPSFYAMFKDPPFSIQIRQFCSHL